jgi:hypothetical protein
MTRYLIVKRWFITMRSLQDILLSEELGEPGSGSRKNTGSKEVAAHLLNTKTIWKRIRKVLVFSKFWSEIAGEIIASRVWVVDIDEAGKLILGTSFPAFKHEIMCLRRLLMQKAARLVPSVRITDVRVELLEKSIPCVGIDGRSDNCSSPCARCNGVSDEEVEEFGFSPEDETALQQINDAGLRRKLRRIFVLALTSEETEDRKS